MILLLLSVALAEPLPAFPAQADPASTDCTEGAIWAGTAGWVTTPADCDLIALPPTRASYLRKVEVAAEGCYQRFSIASVSCEGRIEECAADTDEARKATADCWGAAKADGRQQWIRGAGVGFGGGIVTSVALVLLIVLL